MQLQSGLAGFSPSSIALLEAFDSLVLGLVVEADGNEDSGSRGRWRGVVVGVVGFLMGADGPKAGPKLA
ncbi:MAG: hypothetical protein NXI35_38145, partial [bacterium]|nr:hypothetical protein [bacterium]